MALTVATASNQGPGKGRTVPAYANADSPVTMAVLEIDFDSSYPTGGEALDLTSTGQDIFRTVYAVMIESKGGYTFTYDYSNKKVLAYWVDTSVDGAAQAQVANTTDLSAVTGVRVVAFGKK